ncbi:winged helix-turn-helix transcriptional regulator [Candidatus Azambacteria bacterium]|nr:winged helix-turn-helix transcriptional regulator [Candidatus Azambacteria bacterium]
MRKKTIITRGFPSNRAIRRCAKEFGVVGDPTRMKICWLLCRHPELSVSEIAERLGVSLSVVSHSLRRLKECALVRPRRNEKKVFYHLLNTPLNRFLKKSLRSS